MIATALPVPPFPPGGSPLCLRSLTADDRRMLRDLARSIGIAVTDVERLRRTWPAAREVDRVPTWIARLGRAVVVLDDASSSAVREDSAGPLDVRLTRYARGTAVGATIDIPGVPTVARIDRGSLGALGRFVVEAVPAARGAAVLFDPNAGAEARRAADSLRSVELRTMMVELMPGERAKTLDAVERAWRVLGESGLTRDDVVVAVGGGGTLDAAGFTAATFHRGVALINVPTTLLAMADAALGGKVGIDLDDWKNPVGTYHHPRLVVVDPSVLDDLPPAAVIGGLGEIVKVSALASPLALSVLEDEIRSTSPHLDWLIEQALRVKAAYVAADPDDRGVRRSLNLGHTFAHALETASRYSLGHGEAVAIGLVAASRLGEELGVTPAGTAERLTELNATIGLPSQPPEGLHDAALLGAMEHDKKRTAAGPRYVLPTGDGAVLAEGVDPEDALRAMRMVRA